MDFFWWITVTVAVVWLLLLATALTRLYIKNHTFDMDIDEKTLDKLTKNF